MMLRRTAVIAIAIAISVGCASFSTTASPDDAGAMDGGGDMANDAAGVSEGGDAADASRVTDDGGRTADAACDAACPLFEDSFERAAITDVIGPWTSLLGSNLSIITDGAHQGVLRATLAAATGTSLRTALLSKDVGMRGGVYLKFDFFVAAISGTFGGADSYCDVAHVAIGDTRIADVYINSTVARFYLYGPNEMPGTDLTPTALHQQWRKAEMWLGWSAASQQSTLMASFDGAPTVQVQQPFSPTLTGTTNVRVGLQCRGTSPAAEARIDAVVVKSFP